MDVFEYFGSFCANCKLFGWEQPDPRASPLKRCTGCRKIWYCSQECQEEHWKKVHKRHCKFFSGKKGLEGTVVHNKDNCDRCVKQEAAGKRVFKEEDPTYICFFDPLNPKAEKIQLLQEQYPLPSEDSPRSQCERIFDLLQILLLKIKLTEQPVFRLYPKEVEMIEDILVDIKAKYYVDSVVFPKNCHVGHNSKELVYLVHSMSRLPDKGGRFQIWQTFKLIFGLEPVALSSEGVQIIKKPEISIPKDQRKISQLVRGGSFSRAMDNILEVLGKQLVPQKDLKAIFNLDDIWNELFIWANAVCGTVYKLLPTRCDFCFLLAPVTEVHRSICLKKNYCSPECSIADKAVHTTCCENPVEVEKRKVKNNGDSRRGNSNQQLEEYKRLVTQRAVEHGPVLEHFVTEAMSKLKKMRLKEDRKKGHLPEVD